MKTNLMAILATTTMLAGTAEASEVIFAQSGSSSSVGVKLNAIQGLS